MQTGGVRRTWQRHEPGRHTQAVRAPRRDALVEGRGTAVAGLEAVAELRLGTPEGAEAQFRVSEGMISNESRMREIRTLGSMSGEGNVVKLRLGHRQDGEPPETAIPSTLEEREGATYQAGYVCNPSGRSKWRASPPTRRGYRQT